MADDGYYKGGAREPQDGVDVLTDGCFGSAALMLAVAACVLVVTGRRSAV